VTVESEASQDRVHVDGTLRYKILYISDDDEQAAKSINTTGDFSYGVDVFDARSGMKTKARCEVEHIDYKILNGRKINVKTILKISAKVMDEIDQEFINDIRGVEGIQILKDKVDMYCYLGENNVLYNAEEDLEIPVGKPPIKEILRSDVKIVGKDCRIDDNKIIAKGDINILTLYIGDNEERSIQFMEHEIPFAQFIDLPGIGERSECEVDYGIKNVFFSPSEDSDGELRVLKAEIAVSLDARATDKRAMEIISDAYGLKSRIDYDRQLLKINRFISKEKSQVSLKEIVTLDGNSPDISEVFNVLCKPSLFEYNCENGFVDLQGAVKSSILYVANNTEQPVFSYNSELPFNQRIEVDGIKPGTKCDVDMEVEHCNYSMLSANEVEIRIVLNINVKIIDPMDISFIADITESPVEERCLNKYPSITIYFAQPEDNLWKIAKRYCTTVEDICRVNEINRDDVIEVGQQIMVPRKIS
jgi:nucleoid-associated protein YgaU